MWIGLTPLYFRDCRLFKNLDCISNLFPKTVVTTYSNLLTFINERVAINESNFNDFGDFCREWNGGHCH